MFGPLIFGIVSERTGSQRLAVLSLLPLFLVGLFLMTRVDARRAMQRAKAEAGG
jgi:UMF1 family MFS transporter